MKDVRYDLGYTPPDYKCSHCEKAGVRLWREYARILSRDLFCTPCAERDQKRKYVATEPHSIGWLVAAVPDVEGVGFWGYTSVPDDGVKWWDSLHD